MKILYITTIGGTMGFFVNIVQELIRNGHTVDLACQPYHVPEDYIAMGCRVLPLSCDRSIFNNGNFKAIKEIHEIVEKGKYDIVHCHTPIAAACTRIACRYLRKRGTKVIYTAHGFHFYKGAPLKNWILFYPIEWLCSWWTDVLITINKEDYQLAKRKLHSLQVEYVPGVGVDLGKFADSIVDIKRKKKELGIPEECKLIISVGELNTNKNHQLVLKALDKLDNSNIYYMIAGQDGPEKEKLLTLSKQIGMQKRFTLLGYRSDVFEIYKAADLFILPSFREGLSVSTMEALASGIQVLASNIRGNKDLVCKKNLFDPNEVTELSKLIYNCLSMKGFKRINRLPDEFTLPSVNRKIQNIYKRQLELKP